MRFQAELGWLCLSDPLSSLVVGLVRRYSHLSIGHNLLAAYLIRNSLSFNEKSLGLLKLGDQPRPLCYCGGCSYPKKTLGCVRLAGLFAQPRTPPNIDGQLSEPTTPSS